MNMLSDKRAVMWIGMTMVLGITGVLFFFLFEVDDFEDLTSTSTRIDAPEVSQALIDGETLSHDNCIGEGPVTLTHSPMDLEDFNLIIPYGLMIDAHVTPIDHQYFSPTDWSLGRDSYNVYAMTDGKVVDIQRRLNPPNTDEYRLVFMHSCTFFTYFDLVTSLSPSLMEAYEENESNNYASMDFEVKGGQQIGKIGGQTLDFAVWNTEKRLEGYVFPEHYEHEIWKIFTDNPYDYYSEELNELLMAKTMRTAEPIQGRLDNDIEGTLQGNWFVKDTNWYAGVGNQYWSTHLSISPDHWDPTGFIFSIGDYDGEAMQFGFARDSVSPAEVTIDSGVVKYGLYQYGWSDPAGNDWDRQTFIKAIRYKTYVPVMGTALVQVLENNEIQVEVFPSKVASEVRSFTSNSVIYER